MCYVVPLIMIASIGSWKAEGFECILDKYCKLLYLCRCTEIYLRSTEYNVWVTAKVMILAMIGWVAAESNSWAGMIEVGRLWCIIWCCTVDLSGREGTLGWGPYTVSCAQVEMERLYTTE